MSDFAGFFEDVTFDWTTTAAFYKRASASTDATTGIPVAETDSLLGSVPVGIYTTTSQETNINDKFKNNKIGEMVINKSDLTFSIDTQCYALISGEEYLIEGTDNIGFQDEILLLTWRKDV